MKIIKLTELCPLDQLEPVFVAFMGELSRLSNLYGIAVSTTGGIVVFDPERDTVRYERDPRTSDLEPIISAK